MLSKLAKIANRLDSIGLTKEADVLDAFIKKLAEDGTPAKPEGTSAPVTPKGGATTWEDNGYTYSYNPNTIEMFIVSGPNMTAPKKITSTSNPTVYYTILNQYEAKMGLPKTKPVLPLTDETEIFNMIKYRMSLYNGQIPALYSNRLNQLPDLKGTWTLSFTINKDGSVKNAKATPAQGTTPDPTLEASMAKAVTSWKFAAIAYEQPVNKSVRLYPDGY